MIEIEAEKEDICIWIEMIEIKYNIKIDIIGCNFKIKLRRMDQFLMNE